MNTYLILRRDGWSDARELEHAATLSSRIGTGEMPDRVRWIRSYVTRENNNRLGTVCVFQGTDPESVAEHARRAGLPCDEVIAVIETVVINDDPVPAA